MGFRAVRASARGPVELGAEPPGLVSEGLVHLLESGLGAAEGGSAERDKRARERLRLLEQRASARGRGEGEAVPAVEDAWHPETAQPFDVAVVVDGGDPGSEGHASASGRGDGELEPLSDSQYAGGCGDERVRSEEHTSELQSQFHLVCRL